MSKYLFSVFILMLFSVASAADSGTPTDTDALTADEVVARMNARDEGKHLTRRVRMTLQSANGKTRERETIGFRKFEGETKYSTLIYLEPTSLRDTVFLTIDYPKAESEDDQWLYLPATRKVRRISASDRGDYFLGTDFTYEDIKKDAKLEADDFEFRSASNEAVDGFQCHVIEGHPISPDVAKELGYGRIKFWVDRGSYMPRKSMYWDTSGNLLKTVVTQDIRLVDGIWTMHRTVAENHKTGHKTIFEFSDIDYSTPPPDSVFTTTGIRRGARIAD